MIERWRLKASDIETIEWTGDNGDAIQDFARPRPGSHGFRLDIEPDGTLLVFADAQQVWVPLPIGYRLVRDSMDGCFAIGPQGLAAKYDRIDTGTEVSE